MSHAFRPGRVLTALLLLAIWPLAVFGSGCAACPQRRGAAPCCHPGAQATGGESGPWISRCCHQAAPSSAVQPASEARLIPEAPAGAALPAGEAPVPVPEKVSGPLPVRPDVRPAIPLYTLFSVLLI